MSRDLLLEKAVQENRFTLKRGVWYACEIIGDEFSDDCCSYSPIKVTDIHVLSDGSRRFDLEFVHANYPEGAQEKVYRLRTIERGARYLLSVSIDHSPARYLQIYDLSESWLMRHFGKHGMQFLEQASPRLLDH